MSFGVYELPKRETPESSEPKRACGTCRHAAMKFGSITCYALDRAVEYERRDVDGACGKSGKLWEPKPPRLGVFRWIWRLLFGERKVAMTLGEMYQHLWSRHAPIETKSYHEFRALAKWALWRFSPNSNADGVFHPNAELLEKLGHNHE